MNPDADRRFTDPMLPSVRRPGTLGPVRAVPGSVPRLNGLYEPKPYTYRGTGRDELTAWMDDEDRPLPPRTRMVRVQLAMCEPCWEDLCIACMGAPCCCACQDERRRP